MIFDFGRILTPQTISRILSNPREITLFIDPAVIFLVIKVLVLVLFFGYVLFALTSFLHMRRLETWLPRLQRYHFARFALIHLLFALVGWTVAFIWL